MASKKEIFRPLCSYFFSRYHSGTKSSGLYPPSCSWEKALKYDTMTVSSIAMYSGCWYVYSLNSLVRTAPSEENVDFSLSVSLNHFGASSSYHLAKNNAVRAPWELPQLVVYPSGASVTPCWRIISSAATMQSAYCCAIWTEDPLPSDSIPWVIPHFCWSGSMTAESHKALRGVYIKFLEGVQSGSKKA